MPRAALDVLSPKFFATYGYPHEARTRLRNEQPVAPLCDPGHGDFWAITKHSDICEISKQPEIFSPSERQGVMMREELTIPVRTLVNMDPPDHRSYRDPATIEWSKS